MIDENSSISWRNQHGTFGIHYIGNYGLQGTPRENHQAVLVDVFCGIDVKGNLEDVFAEEAYDIDKAAEYMHSFDAGLNEMIESRRRFFGPNVLELCEAADVVFLALHGANGEDGKVQATFDLLGIPYTGTGYLSSALAMDKSITKQFFRAHHVPTPNGVTLKKARRASLCPALAWSFRLS